MKSKTFGAASVAESETIAENSGAEARQTFMAVFYWRKIMRAGMASALCLVLTACQADGPYKAPKFPFAAAYKGASRAVPVLLANAAWWERLRDPVLNRLIAQALQGSPSIDAAQARILQARAAFDATPGLANLSSSVGLNATGTDITGPVATGALNLGFSWLLDPYGAKRAERRAAGGRITVAEAEQDAAKLTLIRALTNAYVDLRYRQELLGLHEQEMRSRRQTLAMTRTLFDAKSATRLEITRSEARLAEIEAQQPMRRAAITAKQNEIAVLIGVVPGALGINLEMRADQPRPDLSPDVGIPADLLRNRPDILIAERRYYIALADLGQARASLYPRLSLTGTITATAVQNSRRAAEYSFGPALQLPVLPGKPARATVEGGRARVVEAHAIWKSTVLSAVLQVENALIDYRAASASAQSSDKAVRLYNEALDLTREVFVQGNATLGDLIDAEQALASAEQARADMRARWGQSFVDLNISLGAGHSNGEPPQRRSVAPVAVAQQSE